MTLIAEDLLLLLLDDEKGTVPAGVQTDTGLGGALLVELALSGVATLGEKGTWTAARVQVAGATPADPLLAAAHATVAEQPRTAKALVQRLGKHSREQLVARLVDRGILEERRHAVLGLFPRTTWPTADATHERGLRARLTDVLVRGAEPDERTAALVALTSALGVAGRSVDLSIYRGDVRKRDVERRAKQVAEGDWAAAAVRAAVDELVAVVVMAAVVVPAAAT